jgi:serine/threonine-protein kinase HipA
MNKKPGFSPFPHIEKLSVQLDFYGRSIGVGTLAWSKDERRAYFEYGRDFLAEPLSLSPFVLAASAGAKAAPYRPFGGLHGMFNDSLPDGWGRLLLDRRLQKQNYDHRLLTPLDRLAYLGGKGMGALRYVPHKVFEKASGSEIDIDWLAAQASDVQAEVDEADVDRLQEIQGGSAGARPKIMIGLNETTGRVVADDRGVMPDGYEPWMVKFKSPQDPSMIGAEEYAYSLMANDAGLDMAKTRLITTAKASYFATQRFDRTSKGSVHVQAVSGLVEADHTAPTIDYDTLLKITRLLTRDERHVRQMFRRMTFNVLAHNRDDHSKNHAYLMTPDGEWRPTPAYDLTLSEGPGGEHNLAIDGEGRNPSRENIMAVAGRASIPRGEADSILQEVRAAVERWPTHAAKSDLSERRIQEIDYLLNKRGPIPKGAVEIASSPID